MSLTAAEQYLLELTNRARLDPLAEAKRFGINLNDNLQAGTISAAPKAALAPNAHLDDASFRHSAWMLGADVFAHAGAGGSSAGDRMAKAGYTFAGSWSWGENLAWTGSTGRVDLNQAIAQHHEGLFRSAGHRVNTLSDSFREIGIGQVAGIFTVQGRDFNASMTTLNFARTGTDVFVTGVAYTDVNRDGAYSLGEGRGGVVWRVGQDRDVSEAAGGYAIGVDLSSKTSVSLTNAGATSTMIADTSHGNAKIDLVGTNLVHTSVDLTLVSGPVLHASALGSGTIDITGNTAANILKGGSGANILTGMNGNDALYGLAGNDKLYGGNGDDRLWGGAGNDAINGGTHNDRLWGDDGADTLWGADGHDQIAGGNGNDKLYGGNGNDALWGGVGNDLIWGQNGADRLWVDAGNDTLDGGMGNDLLTGGAGADRFVFRTQAGSDTITDFARNQGDKIVLDKALFAPNTSLASVVDRYATTTKDGVVLDLGDHGQVLLEDITALHLSDLAWI